MKSRWTITTEVVKTDSTGRKYFKAICECGTIRALREDTKSESCGCLPNTTLIGKKFTRLTVLEYKGRNQHGKKIFKCICDCGVIIEATLNNLNNKTKSCGCLRVEMIRERCGKPIEDICANSILNSCKRKTKDTDLTVASVKRLIFMNCFYCGAEPSSVYRRPIDDGRSIKRNGIDRVDNNIGYYEGNCIPCCKICNHIKLNRSINDLEKILTKMIESVTILKNKPSDVSFLDLVSGVSSSKRGPIE